VTALLQHTAKSDLQELADYLSAASRSFGLTWLLDQTTSLMKTEVMDQPIHGRVLPVPSMVSENTSLKNVDTFTHLWSCLASNCSLDREVSNRLAKAGASFGKLWTRV
jgi:hypothetical protein